VRTTLFQESAHAEAERRLRRAVAKGIGTRLALRDTIIDLLHEITGLSGMRIAYGRRADPAASNSAIRTSRDVITIGVTGWSPTLHSIRMEQTVTMPDGEDGITAAIDFAARVHAVLAERAHDAAASGMTRPDDTSSGLAPMAHLVIDRSLAAIVSERPGGCLRHAAVAALREAHRRPAGFGTYIHQDGGRVIERLGDPAERMAREVAWEVSPTTHHFLRYDGVLSLKAETLPVTMTQAMRGRALRDLVRPHPALDDRIVRDLHVDDLGGISLYTITFEPETVSLGNWIG
jgi:hypothetical protein